MFVMAMINLAGIPLIALKLYGDNSKRWSFVALFGAETVILLLHAWLQHRFNLEPTDEEVDKEIEDREERRKKKE